MSNRRRARRILAFAALVALLAPSSARAQEAAAQQEAYDNATSTRNDGITDLSIANSLPNRGDPYGTRAAFARWGITTDVIYTGEVLSNVRGGLRRGSVYGGKLEANIAADLNKLLGLSGLSFYSNAFELHQSKGISRNYVGNLNTISAIEAIPTTRLSEVWLEQKLYGGLVSIRAGQLAADTEFTIANYSLPFITSDWPGMLANNLPGGGSAYPLSTPGIRLKIEPNKQNTFLFGIYDGDPAGRGPVDPEVRNRHGTNFRVKDPALLLAEYQHRYNQGEKDTGLAGIVRLGAWNHLGRFNDQYRDGFGTPLSSPLSTGIAARYRGDFGLYGILDQQLWRPDGGTADDGVAMFTRLFVSPSQRNLIGLFWDAGLLASGLVPGRPKDKVGVTVLYAQLGHEAARYDREVLSRAGLYRGTDPSEISFEVSYVAEIVTGWTVQPNVSYIMRPGAGHARMHPSGAVHPPPKDALVFGLRTTVVY